MDAPVAVTVRTEEDSPVSDDAEDCSRVPFA